MFEPGNGWDVIRLATHHARFPLANDETHLIVFATQLSHFQPGNGWNGYCFQVTHCLVLKQWTMGADCFNITSAAVSGSGNDENVVR